VSAAARASEKKDDRPRRPWRDNIEAIVMAIIMAVMLKYFVVEAYQIPTGSMQPTLMGNDETGIKDRIIVDKLSFHFRDPERFEVVVFRYPLDRSKNFIKRICGMPSEQLKIERGDLWTRKNASDAWQVLRRPVPIQREVWKRIHTQDARYQAWRPDPEAKGWTLHGRDGLSARGPGSVRLPSDGGSVVDAYRDGYPGGMGEAIARSRAAHGSNPIGDLRLVGEVRALPGCDWVELLLREGNRRYRFVLPGPTAKAEERPRIVAEGLPDSARGEGVVTLAAEAFRLTAGRSTDFAVQNMDDLLTLELDGRVIAEMEIPSAQDQASNFGIRVEGEGADFSELEVYRDIFYTEDGTKSDFDIPADSYVMFGDNTQDSSDSRFWSLVSYDLGKEGGRVRGNHFPPQNPVMVPGGEEGVRVFLRDEWGNLRDFPLPTDQVPQYEFAPFVRRDMIVGRAVAVFWPISFALRVWRLQWIH
jgi:signal peptidase I